jgi:hypothetical protein
LPINIVKAKGVKHFSKNEWRKILMKQKLFQTILPVVIVALLLLVMVRYSNGEEKSEEIRSIKAYIVKEGDTLWDISKRFYNNPYYWPKIWEKNPYIQNPHWIYPGEPIYLHSEMAPVAALPPQPAEKEIAEKEMAEKEIAKEYREMPSAIPFSERYTGGILPEEDLQEAGGIVGAYEDKLLLSQGDMIYIQLKENTKIEIGQRYGIFRVGQILYHPKTGAMLGRVYRILGYAEILNTGDGKVTSARIVSSIGAIQIGDRIKIFEFVQKPIVVKESRRLLEGCIVAQLEDKAQIAQHDIVFIDLGLQDGIEVGDQLFVMEKGRTVKGYSNTGEVRLPDQNVAKLVVVKSDRTASVALVTDSQKSFTVGALITTQIAQPGQ